MSKIGPYSRCRFCPLCGAEALEKDRYLERKNNPKPEYICRACGLGFRIGESSRVYTANVLFAQHRKYRTHKTMSQGVSPEVAEKCIAFLEGPNRKVSLRSWLRSIGGKSHEDQ